MLKSKAPKLKGNTPIFSMRMNIALRKKATEFAKKDGRDLKSLIEISLVYYMENIKPVMSKED